MGTAVSAVPSSSQTMLNDRYWVALAQTPGLSPKRVIECLEHLSEPAELYHLPAPELRQLGLPNHAICALAKTDWAAIDQQVARARQAGIHLISHTHQLYPCQLREIAVPPLLLYVLGDVAALQWRQLALVGSRNPTPQGLANARSFAYELSLADLTITSGLALGIDGAAHEGALAACGKTIAVLGTGLNQIYPRSHRDLARRIVVSGGALVSEFPLDEPAKSDNFPRRNRIISGLSLGVFVVEAAVQSGSLITARYAVEQGRDVFALPGSVQNPVAKGCHLLLKQGAKLVETVNDILEEFPFYAPLSEKKRKSMPMSMTSTNDYATHPLAKEMEKLLASLGASAVPIDELALLTEYPNTVLAQCLLILELQGKVVGTSVGYQRIE